MNKNEDEINRTEILFLYDARLVNPNGDPLNDNKPRIVNNKEIVTDVRLKRSIRDFIDRNKESDDFLKHRKAKTWLILEKKENGKPKTKEEQLKEKPNWNEYTDIKLFGATMLPNTEGKTKENKNVVLTGPVQFKIGTSLNEVQPIFIKGTTVSPSAEGRGAGTFTERWVVNYALISFYGLINENTTKLNYDKFKANLTKDDVDVMLYSMWHGIQDLNTQSKVGERPRFILTVEYSEKNFQIGNIDNYLKLENKGKIELPDDVKIDITELIDALNENIDKIEKIRFFFDRDLKVVYKDKDIGIMDFEKSINKGKARIFDKEFKFLDR